MDYEKARAGSTTSSIQMASMTESQSQRRPFNNHEALNAYMAASGARYMSTPIPKTQRCPVSNTARDNERRTTQSKSSPKSNTKRVPVPNTSTHKSKALRMIKKRIALLRLTEKELSRQLRRHMGRQQQLQQMKEQYIQYLLSEAGYDIEPPQKEVVQESVKLLSTALYHPIPSICPVPSHTFPATLLRKLSKV